VISNDPAKPIGNHPDSGLPIYVMNGRFGPYVQLGDMPEKKKGVKLVKPRRASIPKEKDPAMLSVEEAATYLSLPRVLGNHPDTGEPITASIGRFGPFIVHQKDFRSLKVDDVYSIELPRALEIFKEEKKKRGFAKKAK
jgi:DNA topoisomerase-1